MKTAENIDLTIPRRRYIYDDINLTNCSECGSPLIDQNCTILLQVKSETDEAEFITNTYDTFNNQIKKDFLLIIEKLKNGEENSKKINGSYFG